MNAYRHGLTGQIDVRTPEAQEAHDKFSAPILSSLAPAEGVEHQFALSVAEDHWRLNRARSIENNIFTIACSFQDTDGETEQPDIDLALADARTFVADPERFQLLTIYERRIHCNMTKSLKQLTELQATRRALEEKEKTENEARRAQAFEEASLLVQLSESEGEPCDPAGTFPHPNGFVFSTAEIIASIRFTERLNAARALARPSESSPRSQPARRAA